MTPATLELVQKALSDDEPLEAREIAIRTDLSVATVYSALVILGARRHHVGKNTFAYTSGTRSAPTPVETPGTIEGMSWAEYTQLAIEYVSRVHLRGDPTAESFTTGFQQIADTFETIAAHVRAVEHRPDWRIVLGLDTDTENPS